MINESVVITVLRETRISSIPWKSVKVHLVAECSEDLDYEVHTFYSHIQAATMSEISCYYQTVSDHLSSDTVEHVVIFNPGRSPPDMDTFPLLLAGINEDTWRPSMKVSEFLSNRDEVEVRRL